jgi:hypothetical protein
MQAIGEAIQVIDVKKSLLAGRQLNLIKKNIIMTNLKQLQQKKTIKRYNYQETLTLCLATSDPDSPSPSTLTTTHLLKR